MNLTRPRPSHIIAALAAAIVAVLVLNATGAFNYDVWVRETPLVNPVSVTNVSGGTITLADGHVFRPAGVRRADGVSSEAYDAALRVMCAQGVVVIRDLGDGSAFLLAEPRFYNSCGTRGYNGSPRARWAGSYFQCPMSELLIYSGYAQPTLDHLGLTPHERWRLEGAEHFNDISDAPTRISEKLIAFRFGVWEREFSDYDATLDMVWKPVPE